MKPGLSPRRDSLRTRLILWNVGTLAVILVSLGGIVQYAVRTSLFASIRRDLADKVPSGHGPGGRIWNNFGGRPGPPDGGDGRIPPPGGNGPEEHGPGDGGQDGRGPAPPGLDGFRPKPRQDPNRLDWRRPRVFSVQGLIGPLFDDPANAWDSEALQQAAQGQNLYTDLMQDGEYFRVYSHPLYFQGRLIAVTQAAYPLTETYRTIAGLNRVLLTLIPVALLLAGLGGALLTDRALRPVRQITQTAQQIGANELSRRLPVAGNDEFARLAMTFNAMLSRLEMEFAQRAALVTQLEELIEQQRRFTGDASHELRTPLTVIKANTSLLLPSQPAPEEWREAMEDIDRAASSMTRLVQDLLLLTRSDGGQLGRNVITIPVTEMLERAAQNVRKAGNAPVALDIFAPDLAITGNPDEITRLVTNLLENAARYTPRDGEIRLTARTDNAIVQIQVIDTGAGIAPEHLPHLCERFYRVDAARSRPDGGTGLGLAICKSIVEAHGGTLHFASELGKGTTVTIRLPRAEK